VNTPDRFIWGTRPSALAREAAALTGHRARVIDLGCGEGRDTVFLAEQGHEVIGIDLSIEGLQKAQRLAERRGAHVQCVCAALPDLPVRGSFDLVHSCGSIHYVARTDRGALFERLRGLTCPGGHHAHVVFTERRLYPSCSPRRPGRPPRRRAAPSSRRGRTSPASTRTSGESIELVTCSRTRSHARRAWTRCFSCRGPI